MSTSLTKRLEAIEAKAAFDLRSELIRSREEFYEAVNDPPLWAQIIRLARMSGITYQQLSDDIGIAVGDIGRWQEERRRVPSALGRQVVDYVYGRLLKEPVSA